jgi:hypothetical protein
MADAQKFAEALKGIAKRPEVVVVRIMSLVDGRDADGEGEDDRSLTTSDPKPDRSTRHRLSDRVSANTVNGAARTPAH